MSHLLTFQQTSQLTFQTIQQKEAEKIYKNRANISFADPDEFFRIRIRGYGFENSDPDPPTYVSRDTFKIKAKKCISPNLYFRNIIY